MKTQQRSGPLVPSAPTLPTLPYRSGRHAACGQAMTEYLILGMLIAIVLVIGEPSPLEQLFRAIQAHYGRFTMALSLP